MKKKTKILITGGAGFIGGNIARALVKKNYQVRIFDNLSTGSLRAVPVEAEFIKGDLRKKSDLLRALNGIDQVIHAAAKLEVSESFLKPQDYLDVNVSGTLNLLQAMAEKKVKKIIFSSTAAVFDPSAHVPFKETSSVLPFSPYGSSKLAAEELINFFHISYGFDVSILRYFNAYGPGDYKKNPTNVVPKFFQLARSGKTLPLYGDGKMVRDYIYIDDLVDAHLRALKLSGYHVYNAGSGRGSSAKQVVVEILKAADSKSQIFYGPVPVGYPPKMVADISKIKKELNWQPKVSLAQGIKKTAEFYMSI